MHPRAPQYLERGLVLLALIPVVVVIAFILRYGYTVPWLDDYTRVVPMMIMQQQGTLTVAELFVQLGDHRVPIPYAISILLSAFTGGDMRWEIGFGFALMIASIGLMIALYARTSGSRTETLIFAAAAAFLHFSLGQRENWIWGHQKCIFIMVLCTYASAWALDRFPGNSRAFWICLACTVIAAWSFLSGNVLWGVIPIALWLNGFRRWTPFLLWGILAAIMIALYLQGFVPDSTFREEWNTQMGADQIRYMLAYLGNPLTGDTLHFLHGFNGSGGAFSPLMAMLMGLLGVGLLGGNLFFAIHIRRVSMRDLSPWLLLVGFSLGNGVILSIGRGEMTGALVARFITLAMPFWITILALMLANLRYIRKEKPLTRRWRRGIVTVLIACSVVLAVGYSANTRRALDFAESYNRVMEQCFLTRLEADPRCKETYFFHNSWTSQEQVIELLVSLERERMFLFRDLRTESTLDIQPLRPGFILRF